MGQRQLPFVVFVIRRVSLIVLIVVAITNSSALRYDPVNPNVRDIPTTFGTRFSGSADSRTGPVRVALGIRIPALGRHFRNLVVSVLLALAIALHSATRLRFPDGMIPSEPRACRCRTCFRANRGSDHVLASVDLGTG